MNTYQILSGKAKGKELTREEISAVVAAATHGTWPDYQLAAFLMAVFTRGMSEGEVATLTRLMADSGRHLDLSDVPGPKVDKHSTGGVGDKTSLILGPLAAACGVLVPMMSGRGLGHAGGTLDKLESVAGYRVALSVTEIRAALGRVGLAIFGQTADIAPADRKLYALRDVTGTVESIPLITASILSKKLAEGITGLVMDVKSGRGAYMKTRADSRALAESLVRVGTANGLRVTALLTAMDAPLGRYVGNALEVIEAIETLKGQGPKDLTDLSVLLAARMVKLAGLAADDAEADRRVRKALDSGAGLEVFRKCIEQQGGDPRVVDDYSRLPTAPRTALLTADITSDRPWYVVDLDAEKLGVAAMRLGAGRDRAEDGVDHAVGVVIRTGIGQQLIPGEPVFEVHYRDEAKLKAAAELLHASYRMAESPPAELPLVLEEIA